MGVHHGIVEQQPIDLAKVGIGQFIRTVRRPGINFVFSFLAHTQQSAQHFISLVGVGLVTSPYKTSNDATNERSARGYC